MIISSIACILYCNHLTSSYKGANEKLTEENDEKEISTNNEQEDLEVQALLEGEVDNSR